MLYNLTMITFMEDIIQTDTNSDRITGDTNAIANKIKIAGNVIFRNVLLRQEKHPVSHRTVPATDEQEEATEAN